MIPSKVHGLKKRLQTLRKRHATLQERIDHESSSPRPNDLLIKAMKKLRLRIKDDMTALARAFGSADGKERNGRVRQRAARLAKGQTLGGLGAAARGTA